MADGKWITDLTSMTAVADAARRTLAMRLESVREGMGRVLRAPARDPEPIHQLRVSTRRAGAAVSLFRVCLPDKPFRLARRQLRRIRQAAGAARDWDVLLHSMAQSDHQPDRQRPAWDLLIGYAVAQRESAQVHLEAFRRRFPFAFDRLLAETVAAVRKPHPETNAITLLDLAGPMLTVLVHRLREAASGDLHDFDHLHQVRIAGKRLRYAMEVFAYCFSSEFRENLYTQVEEMQEILGHANDSHVARGRLITLRNWLRAVRPQEWRRYRPGIDALLRNHQERLPQARQWFIDWWKRWQQAGGEAALLALLPAGWQPMVTSSPLVQGAADDPATAA
jgi:CHAD domain-containing protein